MFVVFEVLIVVAVTNSATSLERVICIRIFVACLPLVTSVDQSLS